MEWRKHMEANSSLMKRFDESRVELEKVLKMAQHCLTERGNPEELLKKHTVRKSFVLCWAAKNLNLDLTVQSLCLSLLVPVQHGANAFWKILL